MIYLIYGEDTFRSLQKLKEIEAELKSQGFVIEKFDEDNFNLESLISALRPNTLFQKKRVFVLISLLDKHFAKIKEYINSTSFFVFYEIKEVKNEQLQFFQRNAKVFYFPLLDIKEVKKWVEKEFQKDGYKIHPIALETLVDFVGEDLWQMSCEIQKLKTYALTKQEITPQDVLLLVKPKIDLDIFKTIKALAYRQKKEALRLIYKHLQKGDSPLYILSMVLYQFRLLLLVKEIKKLPYPQKRKYFDALPFQIKKEASHYNFFSLERLKKIYKKLFQLDLMIKTGQILPEEGLELLLADI